jgi:hypothetical protein
MAGLPTGISVEGIRHGRATLNELAEKAGRDPSSLNAPALRDTVGPGELDVRLIPVPEILLEPLGKPSPLSD